MSKKENELIFEGYIKTLVGENQEERDYRDEYGESPDHAYKHPMMYYELHHWGPAYVWIITKKGEDILKAMGLEEMNIDYIGHMDEIKQHRLYPQLDNEIATTKSILEDLQPKFPDVWKNASIHSEDGIVIGLDIENTPGASYEDAERSRPLDFLRGLGLDMHESDFLGQFDGS